MRRYFEGKIFGQKSHIYTSSAQDTADPDAAVNFEVNFQISSRFCQAKPDLQALSLHP